MADEYDFQINDLKFRAAISDKHPYQRATAPFRKEQFDSAPTVGDQSLTGWWTRGQLSFHKGAGLKYYEVLEGEAVLDRFQSSDSVNVWEPGQATLIDSLADLAVAASSATPGALSGVSGMFYTTATGMKFWDGTTATAITTSDGGVPSWVTSDGRHALAVNTARIERQAASDSLRTNHVANPSFEVDTTGWSTQGEFPSTLTRVTTEFHTGSAALEVEHTTNIPWAIYALSGLTSGATYKVTARVKASFSVTVMNKESAGNGDWEFMETTFTASGTTEDVDIFRSNSVSSGSVFYVDAVMVTEFPFDGDYFDGDTLGTWTGTAHASKSTYATNDPAATYALWRHGDAGHQFVRCWWAKGRIWAVDNTGRWYTLNPAGGTAYATDAVWASGRDDGAWSLADTPGAVFMADAGTIYALTVDVNGTAIDLTAPVVAGVLPAGETITAMGHYLGYLIICTNKGVRVAVVDAAQLIYGPHVIEGDFSNCTQVGAAGNLVYVVGEPENHDASTVCALDLTQEVAQLRPAWSVWQQLNNVANDSSGVLVGSTGRLFAWAGNLYGQGTTLASSGSITTGYHRFGTLDPKSFRTVTVRRDPDSQGTIAVYRVDADGTETLLGSLATGEQSKTLDLSMTAAAERIALKFVLTPGVSTGPELLGYQIKAQPVPERMRLLRWPLMLVDTFRTRYGRERGTAGGAFTALTELEALESGQAVVTFTDHRTGETGSAFIESVEFESNTPSSHNTTGFGGVAQLTLRVLD